MSSRVHLRHSEARFDACESPSAAPATLPPFSFSTTTYRYAETDCDSVDRRRRVTAHLKGVRYYGYRYYNPDLGRWPSRDPIMDPSWWMTSSSPADRDVDFSLVLEGLVEDGDINTYAFVKNVPVYRFDSLGLRCECPPGSNVGREPDPSYTPGQDNNGCGGIGGLIGVPIPVPDDPMPWVRRWSISCPFTSACNGHDTCYATCNMNRRGCDYQFLLDLKARCRQCADSNFGRWDPRKPFWRGACYNMARLYYTAVRGGGGADYDTLQDRACHPCCCP